MKIICVGANYKKHNVEMGRPEGGLIEDPVIFLKPDSALMTDTPSEFYLPDFSSEVFYEAEIVVKISKAGKNIEEKFAHRYYDEISIGLDLTARDLQAVLKSKGLPWELSKGFDNSAIVGSFISKEGYDMNNLRFDLLLNDNKVQDGNTKDMIHPIDKVIAFASRFFTLKTGDLLFTGTPAGVGKLSKGDHLLGAIEGKKLLETSIF